MKSRIYLRLQVRVRPIIRSNPPGFPCPIRTPRSLQGASKPASLCLLLKNQLYHAVGFEGTVGSGRPATDGTDHFVMGTAYLPARPMAKTGRAHRKNFKKNKSPATSRSPTQRHAPYRRLPAVHTVHRVHSVYPVHNGYPRTRRRRQPGIGPEAEIVGLPLPNVGHGATTTNTLIAGSAVRAFAQPTLAQANRLFQQRLSFGSLGVSP